MDYENISFPRTETCMIMTPFIQIPEEMSTGRDYEDHGQHGGDHRL